MRRARGRDGVGADNVEGGNDDDGEATTAAGVIWET
jgi:hypothetical protein